MTVKDYNRCVDDYSDGLYRYLLKQTKDRELSKDLVQESFMRLWEKRHDLKADKSKSYLFTTAHHALIDHFRKNRRITYTENSEKNAGSSNEHYSDINEVLNEAVDRLPGDQKSVVLLRDYEGYSYKEISQITGLSEQQVKVYIFRARTALKKYIVKPEYVI
jgi:RNA polymerase sigma-70 factor (ECF subfamily)